MTKEEENTHFTSHVGVKSGNSGRPKISSSFPLLFLLGVKELEFGLIMGSPGELTWETRSVTGKLMYCADFAAKKHKFQKRLDREGTPYINHPIGVARILTEEGHVEDLDIIQAALLHDTVEDTDTTFEELERHFGPLVTGIVREVTDKKDLEKAERKRLQILTAPTLSKSAKILRMADKIYNLRDLTRSLPQDWTEERRREYFEWAEQVVRGTYDAHPGLSSILQALFVKHKESIASS